MLGALPGSARGDTGGRRPHLRQLGQQGRVVAAHVLRLRLHASHLLQGHRCEMGQGCSLMSRVVAFCA